MDSRTASALAVVGVGLACGCCTSPPTDVADTFEPRHTPSPRTPSPPTEPEQLPPLQLPKEKLRTPERVHRPVPRRADVSTTLDKDVPSSSSSAVADSPPPARRRRKPFAAVIESETPMRTAIGPFCPIVEHLHVGTEVLVNTESQDKRQVPWVSATTPGGATGWLPRSFVRLTDTDSYEDAQGLDQSFDFRTLRSEQELEPWLDLVCEVFGDLNIPRPYFARHWSSDPPSMRKLSGVLVAVERRSGRMVATVRIFRRKIRLAGGKQVIVGGIGEVSTLKAYRGRGICTRLLKMSLAEMERCGLQASSLHAASAASAIYRRLGWHPVPLPTRTFPLRYNSGVALGDGCAAPAPHHSVRELSWKQEHWPIVVSRLQPLSTTFMSCFHGSLVRDEEYWATWMHSPAEALDADGHPSASVMRGWEVVTKEEGADNTATLIAYAIFKRAGSFSSGAETANVATQSYVGGDSRLDDHRQQCPRELTLMDFASKAEAGSTTSEGWLMHLAKVAAQSYYSDSTQPRLSGDVLATITCPSLLAPDACRHSEGEQSAQGEWMYCDVKAANANMPAILLPRIDPSRHLVMPIDEF